MICARCAAVLDWRETSLFSLLLFLLTLLQRGIDFRTVSVWKVGHFRLREIVWLSFASPVAFFPLGLRLLRAGRRSLFPWHSRPFFHSQSDRKELALVASGALELVRRWSGGRGWPLEILPSV